MRQMKVEKGKRGERTEREEVKRQVLKEEWNGVYVWVDACMYLWIDSWVGVYACMYVCMMYICVCRWMDGWSE